MTIEEIIKKLQLISITPDADLMRKLLNKLIERLQSENPGKGVEFL